MNGTGGFSRARLPSAGLLSGSLVLFLIVFILSILPVRAQEIDTTTIKPVTASTLVSPNGLALSFHHVLSIYEWGGTFLYRGSTVPGLLGVADDTIQLSADSRFLEDNQLTTTSTSAYLYADDPIWRGSVEPFVSFLGTSYVTGGLPGAQAAALITRQVSGFGVIGMRYRPPATDLDISASGGLSQESQLEFNSLGLVARGDFLAPTENLWSNTVLSASASGDERFFNAHDERYSNDWASLAVVSPISGASALDSNHAYLNLSLERRDFFFNMDSLESASSGGLIKQERTALALHLSDSINYPIVPNVLTSGFDAEFDPGKISRASDISSKQLTSSSFSSLSTLLVPNDISELAMSFAGRLELDASPAWLVQGRMSYEESSQNVSLLSDALSGVEPSTITKFAATLDQSSYSQRVTQAGAMVRYLPNTQDTLATGLNANLLNYDTPSPLNDDDHDNLITSATLHAGRRFDSNLDGGFTLLGARTHLVYLKSSRSAENNVSQSLALFSYANYTTPQLLLWASGEVFANYTTLDYLDSIPLIGGVGNYLLRGLTLSDSMMIPIGIRPVANAGPVTLEEGATLRISERGSYNTAGFSEVLGARVTELSATLLAGITDFGGTASWDIRAGAQAFILSRVGPNTAQAEEGTLFQELERQTRIGPLLIISLLRTEQTGPTLSGSIWYSVIKDETFDVPSITRAPQIESYLTVRWMF